MITHVRDYMTKGLLIQNFNDMKKLIGLKGNFSSENTKLKREDLKLVNGGKLPGGGKAIPSNLVNENGSHDTDYYDESGNWISRGWCCNG